MGSGTNDVALQKASPFSLPSLHWTGDGDSDITDSDITESDITNLL